MKLIIGILLFALGQSLIWFQLNGQFVWPVFKRNTFLVSLIFGIAISYSLINATKFVVEYCNGAIWPSRFIGFSIGIVIFAYLTYAIMKEPINIKTTICLILCAIIMSIQIFWK